MKYRFYSFMNFYLSSLQQGLQSGHLISELFHKYKNDKQMSNILYDWADKDKVMIVCNGGNSKTIEELHEYFKNTTSNIKLPFVNFCEDEQSLNGATTGVGIIVPEIYYNAKFKRGQMNIFNETIISDSCNSYDVELTSFKNDILETKYISYIFGTPEYEFISKIKSYSLAT